VRDVRSSFQKISWYPTRALGLTKSCAATLRFVAQSPQAARVASGPLPGVRVGPDGTIDDEVRADNSSATTAQGSRPTSREPGHRSVTRVGTDDAVRFLAQEGYDPEYGARPPRRTITRLVENELSRLVLGGSVEPGDRVKVEVEDGKLRFDVERAVFEQKGKDREEVGAGVGE
jgi:hypothetical protein